jgi:nucleolar protein 53
LAARSAVPSVLSKVSKLRVTYQEKNRLLRLTKRKRQQSLDNHVEVLEFGAGSAPLVPSAAVENSGKYDAWDANDAEDGLTHPADDFIGHAVKKRKVKVSVVRLLAFRF